MTGREYILKSIELFEESIAARDGEAPIRTVTELARRTGYSVHHFTRLFAAVTGWGPKDYISGRILSEAARRIAETDRGLARIAEDLGFAEYETFSRAFKRRFGFIPVSLRERALPGNSLVDRLVGLLVPRLDPGAQAGSSSRVAGEPAIVEMPGFTLAGLSFFIDRGTASFGRQWGIFMKAQGDVRGRVKPEAYCQFSSWSADEAVDGLSVLCALEVEEDAAQDPLFTVRRVPASSCVRFIHSGEISAIGETYQYIYGDWFASSDVKPLDNWEFQLYRGETTEIYIPVAEGVSTPRLPRR